jgi:hypothetical protein
LLKVNAAMPDMEKAVEKYAMDKYYQKAFDLVSSGRARDAFDLTKEKDSLRDKYGRYTFGQGLLLARRLIEAGTRFVQVNWPAVANGDPTKDAFDTHAANFGPLRDLHCPKLDAGLAGLLEDMDERGLLKETLVVRLASLAVRRAGREHFRQRQRARWPRSLAVLLHRTRRWRWRDSRRALRQIGRNRVISGGEPGASHATARDDLSRARD